MKNVRFSDSSDDNSDDQLQRMNYEDSDSEEVATSRFYDPVDSGSDDELPYKSKDLTDSIQDVPDVKAPFKIESVKRIDYLKTLMEKIHNLLKIGDNNTIFGEAKKIHESYHKAAKYLEDGPPNYFIRFLSRFEKYTDSQWTNKNDLSTKNRKALPPLCGIMTPCFTEFRDQIDKIRTEPNGDETLFYDSETFGITDVKGISKSLSKKKKGKAEEEEEEVVAAMSKVPLFDPEVELTGNLCLGKLTEIISVKYKLRTVHKQTFEQLEELLSIVKSHGFSSALEIKIVISLLDLIVYLCNDFSLVPIKTHIWTRFVVYMNILFDYLQNNPQVEVRTSESSESLFECPLVLQCNLMGLVEHLSSEYRKRLLAVDEFSIEFVQRLKEEVDVIRICQKTLKYLKGRQYCADICIILLDLLHYKYSSLVHPDITTDLCATVEEYCGAVFAEEDASSVLSLRAVLYSIYNNSLHLRWNKAFELYSYCHAAELACHRNMDPNTQVLYNRSLSQLGICAFLVGRFDDAYQCLAELVGHSQLAYLLGHDVSSTQEVGSDRAVIRIPLHMHVNVRLVEYAYLVSALLVHIPSRLCGSKRRRDPNFRHFENVLNLVEKTAIRGPPEDLWEHVVEAAHFLKDGNWRKCYHTLAQAPATTKILSLVTIKAQFEGILEKRVKCECLKMYLMSYCDVYSNISIGYLCEDYELCLSVVEGILGNMIVSCAIDAHVNDGLLVIKSKRSKASLLLLSLVDKLQEQISDK